MWTHGWTHRWMDGHTDGHTDARQLSVLTTACRMMCIMGVFMFAFVRFNPAEQPGCRRASCCCSQSAVNRAVCFSLFSRAGFGGATLAGSVREGSTCWRKRRWNLQSVLKRVFLH